MQVKIYRPTSSHIKFKDLLIDMFDDVKNSKDLAWRLTVRDFKGQYRQSLLGVLWAFITPLMSALVWIFLNASGAVKIEDVGLPYPIFVFFGNHDMVNFERKCQHAIVANKCCKDYHEQNKFS